MKINWKIWRSFDWLLYALPIILVILGIATIYSLTYYENIKLFYNQIIFASIGIILMLAFTFLDYRHLKSASIPIYLIGLIMLVLIFFVGKSSFGATRWFSLGFFDLQPAEIFKLILIIFLSSYLSDKIGNLTFKNIGIAAIITLIPVVLVMLQPDLGTAIILMLIFLSLLIACKLNFKQVAMFLVIISILVFTGWHFLKDYQKERLVTFMNPAHDPYGSGYNVTQSLITVGSGGLFGKGFGHGPQSQLNFLPVAHTDFVFAGIAEATGFAGSIILLALFIILLFKIINLARISKDNFGALLSIGIASFIFFQVIINIGMNIGLAPVTGIPLPFISSGGSSLILVLICIGILQSIYLRHKKIVF